MPQHPATNHARVFTRHSPTSPQHVQAGMQLVKCLVGICPFAMHGYVTLADACTSQLACQALCPVLKRALSSCPQVARSPPHPIQSLTQEWRERPHTPVQAASISTLHPSQCAICCYKCKILLTSAAAVSMAAVAKIGLSKDQNDGCLSTSASALSSCLLLSSCGSSCNTAPLCHCCGNTSCCP